MKENKAGVTFGGVNVSEFEEAKKSESKFSKLMSCITILPIYLAVVLLPLFFINNVPSPFELNKQLLLVGLIGISFLIWVGRMAWKNEIRFKKSFLLIPVLTYVLIYFLSTLFSDYYEQSMWGYFGGEGLSLVTLLALVALFVLIYNNINNYQGVAKYVFSFLLSGLIVVVFGVLQFLNLYLLPLDYAKSASFNFVGSTYVLSIFAATIFLVSVSLFLSKVSKWFKAFLIVLSMASFFILIFVNFKALLIVVLIMLAFILGLTILIEDKNPSQARIIPMIFLVLTLFLILKSNPLLDNSVLPIEVFIKYKTASKISLEAIKNDPLLGSGPTTFANVYKQNRPANLGDFSSINFNNSTSFFLTLASTTGILGVISFLFLVVSGFVALFRNLILAIKQKHSTKNLNSYLNVAIGVSWMFLTILLFVYIANTTVLFLWWFFFALLVSLAFLGNKKEGSAEIATASNNPKASFALSFGFVLVIIALIAVLYLQGQKYVAAVYFQQAVVAGNENGEDALGKTAEKISKAVSLDPNRDSFYRDLAIVHLAFAKEKIVEKGIQNLTPEESNYVSTRFRSALQSLNKAKELNPYNSLNLISVGSLYEEFIVIQAEAGDKAIENYEKAVELDPKNPEIYQAMANVKIIMADLKLLEANSGGSEEAEMPKEGLEYLATAESYLEKALEVKPEHAGANLLLVTVYEKRGETEKAITKAKENIEIFPGSAELYVDLGRIYYQAERLEEAEETLRSGLNINSRYANALYLLGLVLDKKGDRQGSLAEFKKIEENNPDNELLTKIIENLESGRTALFGIGATQAESEFQEEGDSPEDDESQGESLIEENVENEDEPENEEVE